MRRAESVCESSAAEEQKATHVVDACAAWQPEQRHAERRLAEQAQAPSRLAGACHARRGPGAARNYSSPRAAATAEKEVKAMHSTAGTVADGAVWRGLAFVI